ncbi:hypothetical protein [Cellulomonas bogoriensis]|uniref:hypothetical protein n=1 Tax=Cellulomonas bogoriensis TaxID=301388 RepID=UPI0018DD5197|nr:hypothetical protein [Cellulomonas bogoriensis]
MVFLEVEHDDVLVVVWARTEGVCLVVAAGRDQGVAEALVQPCTVLAGAGVPLRASQGGDRGVWFAEVEARSPGDERELDLEIGPELTGGVVLGEGECTFGPLQPPLAVGHERKVLVRAVQPSDGPELSERLREPPGAIRGEGGGFTDDVDPTCTTNGGLGVQVGGLGVVVEEPACHHQVSRDTVGVVLAEGSEAGPDVTVEVARLDVVVDGRCDWLVP